MKAHLTGSSTAITNMTYFSDDTSSNRLRVTINLKANEDGYVSSDYGLTQLIPYSSIQNQIRSLSAGNIKDGVTILGITGNVVELNGDTETVTPTTSQQVITPTSPKNGFTQVTVNAVTSAIDNNIQAGNIKKGVTILGVSGKSSVVDTDNANATANDIIYGKSAYVNGYKIDGQMIKHVGDSTYANQLSAPDNTDHFNINYTSANDKIYIGNFKIGSGYWDGTASSNAYIDKNLVYTRLGLTADKIKSGVKILGIIGTFTSDANATSNDIVSGKTAYVKGQKVTGTISSIGWGFNEAQLGDMSLNNHMIYINPVVSQTSGFYTPGAQAKITTSYSNIATLIGLSADKIKQGETILDIAGTYVGSAMKEYVSKTAMNNDIANIQEGEVVKVVASGTTTHYIKETTMKKLVKEEDTISPQEYTENVDLANDILGEEE